MNQEITFEVLGLAEAIKRNRFIVPPNQREYSWHHDAQVRDLLQDISKALRSDDPYFLGTVVLTRNEKGALEIADGQQRIATTTMVLAAIRDWYKRHGDSLMVQSIENDFLFTIDRSEKERVPKVRLNTDDNEFFRDLIIEPKHNKSYHAALRRSHKLISKAFDAITEYFNELEQREGAKNTSDILNEWIEYLSNKANVVMLTVANAQNAFLMFETLNDRGLKTSQVDLVKNHLFEKADTRLDEAQKSWSAMRGAVETVADNEDDITMDFLRSSCVIISGLTTKKEVMRTIEERTRNKSECIKVLTLLEEFSQVYAAVLNPDHNKWNSYDGEIRRAIHTMNLLGVTQIRPLMIAVAKYFSDKHAVLAFKKLISWSVRFMVMGIRGSRLDDGYARLAHKIYTGEIKNADQLKVEAEKIVIGDAEFENAFENLKVGVARTARYYLRSLEITAKGEPNAEFVPNDASAINLEHVMPEACREGWEHITATDFETHFKRLGNMALLQVQKNSDAGNHSFKQKKAIYSQSSFDLTFRLGEFDSWDASTISRRQKELAKLAVKTWPL